VQLVKLVRIEWDVIAGAIAAVIAMLCHLLGIASEEVVRGVMLLLLALLLVRDLRQEARTHKLTDAVQTLARKVADIEAAVGPRDVAVIGPKQLRQEFTRFANEIHGDVTWYHVCSRMFRRQELFDATLGQLLDNDDVRSIQLLLDEREREAWEAIIQPKLERHAGAAKVRAPLWGALTGGVSFILGETRHGGTPEALVGILEEPFAARTTTASLPRYVLRIQDDSDLLNHFVDLARHASTMFETGDEPALLRHSPTTE